MFEIRWKKTDRLEHSRWLRSELPWGGCGHKLSHCAPAQLQRHLWYDGCYLPLARNTTWHQQNCYWQLVRLPDNLRYYSIQSMKTRTRLLGKGRKSLFCGQNSRQNLKQRDQRLLSGLVLDACQYVTYRNRTQQDLKLKCLSNVLLTFRQDFLRLIKW